MSAHFHTLAQAALELDPAERLQLASELIDSVEGPVDPAWSAAWSAELDRRAKEADESGERGRSWDDVRADLLRRSSVTGDVGDRAPSLRSG